MSWIPADKQEEAMIRSGYATTMFYLLVIGHALNVLVTASIAGTYVPAPSTELTIVMAGLVGFATLFQVAALYQTAKESVRKYRWEISITAMAVTVAANVWSIVVNSTDLYVSDTYLILVIIFAAASCGTLIWLRWKPAAR